MTFSVTAAVSRLPLSSPTAVGAALPVIVNSAVELRSPTEAVALAVVKEVDPRKVKISDPALKQHVPIGSVAVQVVPSASATRATGGTETSSRVA